MPAVETVLLIRAGCSTFKFSRFGIGFMSIEPRTSDLDKERSFESSGGPDF